MNSIIPVHASIVVPTFNGKSRQLEECLLALKHQKTRHAFEIIVVDDGSTDQTHELVNRLCEIQRFQQCRQGPAAARNLGIRKALGEIVLFIDDDCIPEPDWLEAMLQPFSDNSVVGVKGIYLSQQNELIAQFVQLEYEEKYDRMETFEKIDLVDTYSAAFRKEVLIREGGFDVSYRVPSVEDRELSLRLIEKGYKLVFQPAAKVWHAHPKTISEYFLKKFKNGYWAAQLLKNYPRIIRGTSDTPFSQKLQLGLAGMLLLIIFQGFWGRKNFKFPVFVWSMLFCFSGWAMGKKALGKSGILVLFFPFFLFLRAFAFGSGLFWGGCDAQD